MMDSQQPASPERSDQPGKTRTWWHPLLVRMLAFALDSAFEVEQEVSVGKLPLQVDILLIRREGGQLADVRARQLTAERGQPILSLVSRVFLNDCRSIIEMVARGGHEALAHYRYMVQQVKQFRGEEDFAMQQLLSESLEQFDKELVTKILDDIPVDRRLQGLSPEERLRGLPPEERLRGLSPEELLRALPPEFLAGLSAEQAARLRELLVRKQDG